jgi:thiol-disulfide isomerase/thioredoxin
MRLLLFALMICACSSSPPQSGVLEGELALPLSGPVHGGGELSLASFRGTSIVVVFWASWCAPCMTEIPHINALVEEYGDRLKVIGVNMGENEALVYMTQRQRGMQYETILDPKGQIASAWRVRKLPLMLVLDREGRIRFRGLGTERQLKVLLDALVVN